MKITQHLPPNVKQAELLDMLSGEDYAKDLVSLPKSSPKHSVIKPLLSAAAMVVVALTVTLSAIVLREMRRTTPGGEQSTVIPEITDSNIPPSDTNFVFVTGILTGGYSDGKFYANPDESTVPLGEILANDCLYDINGNKITELYIKRADYTASDADKRLERYAAGENDGYLKFILPTSVKKSDGDLLVIASSRVFFSADEAASKAVLADNGVVTTKNSAYLTPDKQVTLTAAEADELADKTGGIVGEAYSIDGKKLVHISYEIYHEYVTLDGKVQIRYDSDGFAGISDPDGDGRPNVFKAADEYAAPTNDYNKIVRGGVADDTLIFIGGRLSYSIKPSGEAMNVPWQTRYLLTDILSLDCLYDINGTKIKELYIDPSYYRKNGDNRILAKYAREQKDGYLVFDLPTVFDDTDREIIPDFVNNSNYGILSQYPLMSSKRLEVSALDTAAVLRNDLKRPLEAAMLGYLKRHGNESRYISTIDAIYSANADRDGTAEYVAAVKFTRESRPDDTTTVFFAIDPDTKSVTLADNKKLLDTATVYDYDGDGTLDFVIDLALSK